MINGIIILFHTSLYTDKLILYGKCYLLWLVLGKIWILPLYKVVCFPQSASNRLWNYAYSSDELIQKINNRNQYIGRGTIQQTPDIINQNSRQIM